MILIYLLGLMGQPSRCSPPRTRPCDPLSPGASRRFALLILAVASGAFAASLVGGIKNLKLRSRIRQLERQLAARPGPASPPSAMPPR
jgi:hypothetical protein